MTERQRGGQYGNTNRATPAPLEANLTINMTPDEKARFIEMVGRGNAGVVIRRFIQEMLTRNDPNTPLDPPNPS